jgi:hypothetical protein
MAQRTAIVLLWRHSTQQWEPSSLALGGELTEYEFSQISPYNIRLLGQGQIVSIAPEVLGSISATQAAGLRAAQIPFITIEQIPYLSPGILEGLGEAQRLAFTSAQKDVMTPEQLLALEANPYAVGAALGPNSFAPGSTDIHIYEP